MYVVLIQNTNGGVKPEFAQEVTLDPANGGYISMKLTSGSTRGVPLWSVRGTWRVPASNDVSDPH